MNNNNISGHNFYRLQNFWENKPRGNAPIPNQNVAKIDAIKKADQVNLAEVNIPGKTCNVKLLKKTFENPGGKVPMPNRMPNIKTEAAIIKEALENEIKASLLPCMPMMQRIGSSNKEALENEIKASPLPCMPMMQRIGSSNDDFSSIMVANINPFRRNLCSYNSEQSKGDLDRAWVYAGLLTPSELEGLIAPSELWLKRGTCGIFGIK